MPGPGRFRIPAPPRSGALHVLAIALLSICGGCGAPGDPLPPLLNIPSRTADLEAAQRGSELVLRWTVPSVTTENFPLKDLARVVVLWHEVETPAIDARAFDSIARTLETLESPKAGEKIERRVRLPAPSGKLIALAVKNYGYRGRTAGLSNLAVLEIGPVLDAPKTLAAVPQAHAIRLEWPRVPNASGYRIYRKAPGQTEAAFLGLAENPPFDDPNFSWGAPYEYIVRAWAKVSVGLVESGDSPPAAVVPEDRFPPSPPGGLRAVVSGTAVELSWNLSPETDTAGYNVYRRSISGRSPAQRARINPELLAAPSFSDKNVEPGHQYEYTITAVDDKGNESEPSAPYKVTLP